MDNNTFIRYKDKKEKDGIIKVICGFGEDELHNAISKVKQYKYIDYNLEVEKRLWALWGKTKNSKEWICLEVGSSKDIKKEIRSDLSLMISKPEQVKKSSAFYSEVFEYMTYMDRTSCKYRKIYEICDSFEWFEIDIDKYLQNRDFSGYNKVNYAEVSYAYETRALFWNPSPAVNGNQEMIILEKLQNK